MASATINSAAADEGCMPGEQHRIVTTLTFSRDWLIFVANETLDIAHLGSYTNRLGEKVHIADELQLAKENSIHYHSSHVFHPSKPLRPLDTRFFVWYGSSLNVAMEMEEMFPLDAHIAILNSASGKAPVSQFFRGTISQENCISRASLLYPCLAQFAGRSHYFYTVNNKPKYKLSNSTCAIFNPFVPVIREDNVRGDLLDRISKFSFVSIPAPNAFVLGSQPIPKAQQPGAGDRNEQHELLSLEEDMRDRCFRILSIMSENGCTDLVLCAFGCGVHGNDPVEVATAIRGLLKSEQFNGRFRTVAFAIQPSRLTNYNAFVEAFPEATR